VLHDQMLAECVATGQLPGPDTKISLSHLSLSRKGSSAGLGGVQQKSCDEEDGDDGAVMDTNDTNGNPYETHGSNQHPLATQLSPTSLLEREVLKNLWQAQQQQKINSANMVIHR
jgi:hypothetical protein